MSGTEGERLARIEGKLDTLIEIRKDHEVRIIALETLILQARGGWKVVLIFIGTIGSIIYFVTSQLLKLSQK